MLWPAARGGGVYITTYHINAPIFTVQTQSPIFLSLSHS
jgi:hypothetical protein